MPQAKKPTTERKRTPQLTVSLRVEDMERWQKAKERLRARTDSKYRMTDRLVLLTALERLEAHLDKLDKERTK